MKILTIGVQLFNKNVTMSKFGSDESFYGYDIVIWDPSTLFSEFSVYYDNEFHNNYIDKHNYDKLYVAFRKRYAELTEFFKNGNTFVLILPTEMGCRGIDRHDVLLSTFISDLLQIKLLGISNGSGKNIELSKDQKTRELFEDYWKVMGKYQYYSSYLNNPEGIPFLFITDYQIPIGTWIRISEGNLIIIPDISLAGSSREEIEKASYEFTGAIEKLVTKLNYSSLEIPPPDWIENYLIPDESEIIDVINKKEAELDILLKSIQDSKKTLNDINKFKLLLYGYNTPLEEQVSIVLNKIGLKVWKGPPSRHDLEGIYDDKTIIIEVKGVNRNASEKHLRELEEWIDICKGEGKNNNKGILIVNAYNNIPLNERSLEVFPQRMIDYAILGERCLITTTQLLGIYILTKSNPELKEKIIKDIISTKGVFKGYEDYKKFLLIREKP